MGIPASALITGEVIDPRSGMRETFRHQAGAAPAASAQTDKEQTPCPTTNPRPFLRRALMLDAAASGATALLAIAAAGLLEGLLGLPTALLRWAGLVLLPYVAFVVYAGTREDISRSAVWAVIVANVLWAIASALLLVSGWVAPTALGYAFVIGQALAVALLGELQYTGLRRQMVAA